MTTAGSSAERYEVIVIGAGHNGLATAALLAKDGRKVLVLERRSIIGGMAAAEEFHPGYRSAGMVHDSTGIRPEVIESLGLESLGLKLGPEPPAIFMPQTDGPGLLLTHAVDEGFSAVSDRDMQRYADYRAFLSRISKFTSRYFSDLLPDVTGDGAGNLARLASNAVALRRLGRKDMMELLRIVPMCVADWLNEWFESMPLRCLLAGRAIDATGYGPWSPGTNGLLLRCEAAVARPAVGGPHALIEALRAKALASGVEIRTNAEVQHIRVTAGRIEGVVLPDGESIGAPTVAASCDPKTVFLRLIASRDVAPNFAKRAERYRCDGTVAKVNLALDVSFRFDCRPGLQVEYARTGETLNHMERASDAVKYGRYSDEPILDLYVPTVASPDMAPRDHSVVSIRAQYAPYRLRQGWTDEQRARLGDRVVGVLRRYVSDIDRHIVAREVLTPADIERRYGLTGGHLHHGEQALDQLLIRPFLQCARYATPIEGLYLCGSGSHPGGGLTCAPGALAAKSIARVRG